MTRLGSVLPVRRRVGGEIPFVAIDPFGITRVGRVVVVGIIVADVGLRMTGLNRGRICG